MPILKPTRTVQINRSHSLARGLVGCWLFNEGSGNKVFDLSGNSNHGTLSGSPAWIGTNYGHGLEFSGQESGEYIDVGDIDGASGASIGDELTILMWINPATLGSTGNTNGNALISKDDGTTNREWLWQIEGTDGLYFRTIGGNNGGTSVYPIVGIWQQIAVVWHVGTKIVTYMNGKEIDDTDETDTSPNTTQAVKIGRTNPTSIVTREYEGIIDHVLIWNRALKSEDINYLYYMPFCMFERGLSPAVLHVSAEGTVELAGSIDASTATTATLRTDKRISASCACATEVTATLKLSRNLAAALQSMANLIASLTLAGQVQLAGTISAALSLTGKLSLVTAGKWFTVSLKAERQWLIDALFAGMTANAFKLGTVLSSGWFWMRRLECSVLYRGLSMDTVDFANILTVAEHDDNTISPPDYISHNAGLSYFYVVRRFNSCGYQEYSLAAAVNVAIDLDGELEEPQPNKVFAWSIQQKSGNKVQLLWFYCPIEQKSQPTRFNIYCDSRTGQINYEDSLATISYHGRRFYNFDSDMLDAGKHLFAVRPMDAEQVENDSLARIGIQIDTAGPDVIDILDAETE